VGEQKIVDIYTFYLWKCHLEPFFINMDENPTYSLKCIYYIVIIAFNNFHPDEGMVLLSLSDRYRTTLFTYLRNR